MFGFWVSVLGSGFWVLGFGFWVLGFGFWVLVLVWVWVCGKLVGWWVGCVVGWLRAGYVLVVYWMDGWLVGR